MEAYISGQVNKANITLGLGFCNTRSYIGAYFTQSWLGTSLFKRKFFIGLLSSVQQFIYNMYIYIYLFLEHRGVILANRWIHL